MSITGVKGNLPPVFTSDMNLQVIKESASVGTVVGTLEATDPEGSQVKYGLSGSDSLSVNSITGAVRVVKPLDREVSKFDKYLLFFY